MVHYKGFTISEEFAGIASPTMWRVRQIAPNGVTAEKLGQSFATEEEARAAIDSGAWR